MSLSSRSNVPNSADDCQGGPRKCGFQVFQEEPEVQVFVLFLLIFKQWPKLQFLFLLKHYVNQAKYDCEWLICDIYVRGQKPGQRSKSTNYPFVLKIRESSHNSSSLCAVVYQSKHVKLASGHGRPQAEKNIQALTPNCPPKTFPAIKDQFMVYNKWYCMQSTLHSA